MKNNKSPVPEINIDEERTFFWIELKINNLFLEQDEVQDEVQDESSLSDTEKKILKFISDKEVSKNEIVMYLGYKKLTGNVRNAIKKLIDKSFIEYTIPEKPTSKKQKYRRIMR
jgi:predicted HTH transcriptional regulator